MAFTPSVGPLLQPVAGAPAGGPFSHLSATGLACISVGPPVGARCVLSPVALWWPVVSFPIFPVARGVCFSILVRLCRARGDVRPATSVDWSNGLEFASHLREQRAPVLVTTIHTVVSSRPSWCLLAACDPTHDCRDMMLHAM